ncbi:hypothetical protein AJ80_07052 [Polytolypa hystricis UAMH7299]|uniref:AAA+ ATPase domain-containing protein n=1 Tax=Polytolypa hystricis (strain UAMH7299) TaxID=1447883 RepID=A0A2B7XSH3_POLH7|nr:hypothetical protein AJ80_07052 [Polytolypa hystricis UAMH7299]
MSESSETLFEFYSNTVSADNSNNDTAAANSSSTNPAPKKESNHRFHDVTELRSPNGECMEAYSTGSSAKRDAVKDKKFGSYSLLLRRIEYPNSQRAPRTQLEIQSKSLRDEFGRIASHFVHLNLHSDTITIQAPYCELYHCREEIAKSRDAATSQALIKELDLLIEFHARFLAQTTREVEVLANAGQITFPYLWALFPPGEKVILQNSMASPTPILSCATVRRYQVFESDDKVEWVVTVTYTCFDGMRPRQVVEAHRFSSFSEVTDITDLPIYPIKYHPGKEELHEYLVHRGRTYASICRTANQGSTRAGAHLEHQGPFWTPTEPDSVKGCTYFDIPITHISGRFIADPEGMVQEMPHFREFFIIEKDPSGNLDYYSRLRRRDIYGSAKEFPSIQMASNYHASSSPMLEILEDQLLTFPARIRGYSLTNKRWGYVLIDDLEEIKWDGECFNKLQIDAQHKEVIRRLVSSHRASSSNFDDIIRGKGLGLIFLLYGPPGSGKTMTAESVAETLQCPLYNVTSGELGYEVCDIEDNLKRVFKLIARWNAVMLLDEADVFMTKRTDDNTIGNAMVSIFLRLLEYQTGVLFLTTNRIDHLDDAFASRIYIQIEYLRPAKRERALIWRQLSRKLDHALSDVDFEQLAEHELSGRQVKNILRTASLYASGSEPRKKLQVPDIEAVLPYVVRNTTSNNSEKPADGST